ncbi:hypothetical protein PVK62_01490 [Aliivibrio sp. S3MY1]|uniref:hypothetical protein n=1 Tax=unclassified Aliivibrio TaxID=2645654 RepID=UPI0023787B56|nr:MULTISPECIES: hypothetical protein [unclassified Aliivibrio]MDD9194504.1 hypothetical protein [Aliivibrio sp. S3MY1]MDD9198157.1 hypothetical protein [Aliivibrio sp. S2MY1]
MKSKTLLASLISAALLVGCNDEAITKTSPQAQLRIAEVNLSYIRIIAPFSGCFAERVIKLKGAFVDPFLFTKRVILTSHFELE